VALTVAASVAAGVGLLIGQTAFSKDVMLNVGLTLNDEQRAVQLLTAEGKDAEIRVSGLYRVVVVPTIQPGGRVLLTAQIYKHDGKDFILLSRPILLAAENQEAAVEARADNGDRFRLAITPHVQ
jgi:hypothetical protein